MAMIHPETTKTCLECGDRIAGRSDKKFCSDQCRTAYHNRQNGDATSYVRNVNNILRRNRRILAELRTKGKARVALSKLLDRGFQLGYVTNILNTPGSKPCHYCYDHGYQILEDDLYLLVAKEDP
jgi:hypothetical protein